MQHSLIVWCMWVCGSVTLWNAVITAGISLYITSLRLRDGDPVPANGSEVSHEQTRIYQRASRDCDLIDSLSSRLIIFSLEIPCLLHKEFHKDGIPA